MHLVNGESRGVVAEVYNDLAEGYDSVHVRKIDLAENRLVFEWLGIVQGAVLDLGSGTGLALEEMWRAGAFSYLGVDVSQRMVDIAAWKFRDPLYVQFSCMDMANLWVSDESMDLVLSTFGSFSYCLNPAEAAAEIWRVLRPAGRIFIMVYGHRYEKRASHVAKGKVPFFAYGARELLDLFSQGYTDIRVWGVSWLAERLPRVLPQAVFDRATQLETRTVGQWWPGECYWLVMEGVKP